MSVYATEKQVDLVNHLMDTLYTKGGIAKLTEQQAQHAAKLLEPVSGSLALVIGGSDVERYEIGKVIDAMMEVRKMIPITEVRWKKFNGEWVLSGPAGIVIEGAEVEVHSSKGVSTSIVGTILSSDGTLVYARPVKDDSDIPHNIPHGPYRNADGELIAVRATKNGQTVAYGVDEDTGKQHYIGKVGLKGLTPEMKLSLEESESFGLATVHCICCGKKLDNEESRSRGVGPVCASKYF